MRTALLLLAFLAIPTFAAQTVWKWVDERGVTHYSDRPVPGATRVDIAVSNAAQPQATTSDSSSSDSSQSAGPAYRNFEIWKPANGESIVNTGGVVPVNIRVDPGLRPGHALFLYLDGKLVEGFPANANAYELKDVPRGTHSVVAVINNRRGARIQETAPVSFTVRQESIANPPVGPALRPPPKPQPRGANKLSTKQPSYADLNGARPQIDARTNAPVPTKTAVNKPGPKTGS